MTSATLMPTEIEDCFRAYEKHAETVWRFLEEMSQLAHSNQRETSDYKERAQMALDTGKPQEFNLDGLDDFSLRQIITYIDRVQPFRVRYLSLIPRFVFTHIYSVFDAFLLDTVTPLLSATLRDAFDRKPIDEKVTTAESALGLHLNNSRIDVNALRVFRADRRALVHRAGYVDPKYLSTVPTTTLKLGEEVVIDAKRCINVLRMLDKSSREIGSKLQSYVDHTVPPSIPSISERERQEATAREIAEA